MVFASNFYSVPFKDLKDWIPAAFGQLLRFTKNDSGVECLGLDC
jgi:hypothetical protein